MYIFIINNKLDCCYLATRGMMSSIHGGGPQRDCDSPGSEGADYATESDLDQSAEQGNGMCRDYLCEFFLITYNEYNFIVIKVHRKLLIL